MLHHDAGGTSFIAGIHLIDLGGLCDRTIAKRRHEFKVLGDYIFGERKPTFIYSAKTFADRIGLERFPELERDYVGLPSPPRPELDGYIRRVRRDEYERVFGNPAPTGHECQR